MHAAGAGGMNPPDFYLVRVWQVDGGFRASARRADQEAPQVFDSAVELARYFAESVIPDARPDSPLEARHPNRGS
jgi:hypothetical protein